MEGQTQETVTTTTETPVSAASAAPITAAPAAAATAQSTAPDATTAPEGVTGETPAYSPNFKFKVLDEEKEFDEWVRGAVKDEATEKKARELFEKAYGLDSIKPKLHKTREELESVRGEYSTIQEGIAQLREHVANNDFGSFFKALNIPKETIFQWVAQDLQYKNLPPEEKQRYDEAMELRRERSQLLKERDYYAGQSKETQLQAMEMELDQAISQPEVNQIMQSFDARTGRVGAFRERLIRELALIQSTTGKKPTAMEGVQSILGLMGQTYGQTPMSPQGIPQQTQQTIGQQKPVISNLKSKAAVSPVKKVPTTMQELREGAAKRIKELGA